jgi:hypothetical protein
LCEQEVSHRAQGAATKRLNEWWLSFRFRDLEELASGGPTIALGYNARLIDSVHQKEKSWYESNHFGAGVDG